MIMNKYLEKIASKASRRLRALKRNEVPEVSKALISGASSLLVNRIITNKLNPTQDQQPGLGTPSNGAGYLDYGN